MLRFAMPTKDGSGYLLGIGLSAENIRRLQAGHPIYAALSTWDAAPGLEPRDVLIIAGDTEESMAADLEAIRAEHRP